MLRLIYGKCVPPPSSTCQLRAYGVEDSLRVLDAVELAVAVELGKRTSER